MVRYSNNGNYGYSWGWGWGYGNGNNGNNDTTEQEVKAATGSGVVIAEHIVLTNYHVVVVCVKLFQYQGVLMAQAVADVLSAALALGLLAANRDIISENK